MIKFKLLPFLLLFFLIGCSGIGVARLVNLEKEDELAKLTYEQINEVTFGYTPLTQFLAFGDGNVRKLEMLLRNKADPNINAPLPPLKTAAAQNRYGFVKLLLEYGADPNSVDYFNGTALHAALENGNAEMVKLLLDNGAKTGFLTKNKPNPNQNGLSELTIAAITKNKNAVALLLERGADPNQYNEQNFYPLTQTIIFQEPEAAELLIKAGANVNVVLANNYTALHGAIENGYNELVKLLLENDATTGILTKDYSENKFNGLSELSRAVIKKNTDVVSLLLAAGADPNIYNSQGVYPLTEAVYSKSYEITQMLLDAGADVNVVSGTGYSALHLAAINKSPSLADKLLAKGANPNIKTVNGITPLHEAAFAGDFGTSELLLKYGAQVEDTDQLGRSAIQFANFQGHRSIVDMLVRNGASPNFQSLTLPNQQSQTQVSSSQSDNSGLWTVAIVGIMNAIGNYYGAKNSYQPAPVTYVPPVVPSRKQVQQPVQQFTPLESTKVPQEFQSSYSVPQVQNGCTNDLECGGTLKCVKPPLSSTGQCVQPVNNFGTPINTLPNPSSALPNLSTQGQCQFDTQCPVSFKCNQQLKVCVKN